MNSAFSFLIGTLFDLYIGIVLLRLFLQWVRADFYNPLSQFVVKVTNPLLLPLRKLIPGFGGIDIASLVLAYLLALVEVLLLTGMLFNIQFFNPWVFALAFFRLVAATFNLFAFMMLLRVLMSWIAPAGYNPVVAVLFQLTEPVLAPIRKLIPPIAGLDFSPMIFLLLLGFLSRLMGIPGLLF